MPSVFNHENNACWGIRQPSCELFFSENNKLNTDMDNKLTVNGGVETKTVSTPNYHVSSNTYYGYQRHVTTPSDDGFECAMDTIENTTPNVDSDIQMTEHNNGGFELQYNGINLIKRKRNYQDVSAIAFKRMRQEEPLNIILAPPPVYHHHHQNYVHTDYPRCQMGHYI